MHKGSAVAWQQFELMMRTGVPHAMDIACELARCRLEVPLPTLADKPSIDLQYYCVIHRAYRAKVLTLFLSMMKVIKDTDGWTNVQACQDTQQSLVDICSENRHLPPSVLAEMIYHRLAYSEDGQLCLASETKKAA